MKKWIYITLFSVCFFAIGCVDEVDDVFDSPASQRMEKALENIRNILVNAPNGWQLDYFSDPTQYGGYTLLLAFKADGTVEIAVEKELLLSGIVSQMDQRTSSKYQIKSETGPTLTFDTYNAIFHAFSDPDPDGIGMGGDYEFIVMDAKPDQIQLMGKKGEVRMTLHKFPENENWDTYLHTIDSVASLAIATDFGMTVNGQKMTTTQGSGYGRNLIFIDENGEETGQAAYCYTTEGIRFYEPVTLNGKQLQNFTYMPDREVLTCADQNANAEISLLFTDINKYFFNSSGAWYFNTAEMGPGFLTYWNTGVKKLQESTGERIYAASLGYSAMDDAWFFNFICSVDGTSGNNGSVSVAWSLPEDTPDQISVDFEGRANETGVKYYQQYGMNYLIAALTGGSGNTYSITPDNPRFPRSLTFTNVNQPMSWFTLAKQVVLWP